MPYTTITQSIIDKIRKYSSLMVVRKHPISNQGIADILLKKHNIKVSREAVRKYR